MGLNTCGSSARLVVTKMCLALPEVPTAGGSCQNGAFLLVSFSAVAAGRRPFFVRTKQGRGSQAFFESLDAEQGPGFPRGCVLIFVFYSE